MKEKNKLKGAMVFYLDVGQLPPYKAEAFMDRVKDHFKKQTKKFKENGVETLWIPVRPNSNTRVEFLPMSEDGQSFTNESTTIKVDEVEIEK